MNTKVSSWILYLVLCLAVAPLATCGGGGGGQSSTDAGSVVLRLEFDPGAKAAGLQGIAQAQFDCLGNGVATVEAQVLDQAGTVIASGGPWPCTDGHGTIDNVTPGQNLRVAAFAKDSAGNTLFTGDVTGVQVLAGQTTDVGIILLTPVNSAPVANAGPDQTVAVGDSVTLNGNASTDVDGDSLTYSWTFISRPPGSTATLSGANTVTPSFTADQEGDYVVQLIVNDGTVDSLPDTVTISTLNSAPVANAGPDQIVRPDNTVTLDGSASSDVDGDLLTYSWSLTTRPSGSTATLSDTAAVRPTFVADVFGTYVAQLIVNDGKVDSLPDTVTIIANTPPVADAGLGQTVSCVFTSPGYSYTASLDGSGSDPADTGQQLAYLWSVETSFPGITATLSDPTTVRPTLTVNSPGPFEGIYQVKLLVDDGIDQSEATVSITLSCPQ